MDGFTFSGVLPGKYYIQIPSAEFEPGGSLEGYSLTSRPIENVDNQALGDNNLLDGYRTGIFELKVIQNEDGTVTTNMTNPSSFNQETIGLGVYKEPESLTVVKKTNDTIARVGHGPVVTEGSDVTWTYEITNNSPNMFFSVDLVDDMEGTYRLSEYNFATGDNFLDPRVESINHAPGIPNGIMTSGETYIFTVTGKAKLGQYTNKVSVTSTTFDFAAQDPETGEPLIKEGPSAKDVSHYYGYDANGVANVKLSKTVVDEKSKYTKGEIVRYKLTVTNDGAIPLTNVFVKDKMFGSANIECTPNELMLGETADCGTHDHIVTAAEAHTGTLVNNADVSGEPVNNPETPVTDAASVTVDTFEIVPPVNDGGGVTTQPTVPNTDSTDSGNSGPVKPSIKKHKAPKSLPHTGAPFSVATIIVGICLIGVGGIVVLVSIPRRKSKP